MYPLGSNECPVAEQSSQLLGNFPVDCTAPKNACIETYRNTGTWEFMQVYTTAGDHTLVAQVGKHTSIHMESSVGTERRSVIRKARHFTRYRNTVPTQPPDQHILIVPLLQFRATKLEPPCST
jgi:hypothetical protein